MPFSSSRLLLTPRLGSILIPAGIVEGSSEIAGSQGEHEHILVAIDAGVYNVRKAICGVVCVTCNGINLAYMIASPWAVAVGGNTQQSLYMQYNTGSQYNISSHSNWSSNNTAIATVSAGLTHGVSPGSTSLYAQDQFTEPPYISSYCTPQPGQACPTSLRPSGSAGGNAQPPPTVSFSNINYVIVNQTATTLATVTPRAATQPTQYRFRSPFRAPRALSAPAPQKHSPETLTSSSKA